jgi:hypothetical protein
MAFSDIDYLDSEDLGNRGKKDKGDIEDEDEGDEDNSEGETIGSEDWSLDKSDDDSQERRDLEDFIVEDGWGKEEGSVDFTESDEEYDSDDSTVWGDSESKSGGDSSENSQVYKYLEDSTDEEGEY